MLLSILVIGIIALVTYFHYLQGFFAATISAIIATIALLLAFGYYEPVVTMMKPGKFADDAHSMALILLFAITYIVLRVIFDTVISGNVRLPPTIDKVGGAVLGIVVGIMASGLIAVAAQALPFGPGIGGYSRYAIQPDQALPVPTGPNQMNDRHVYDQMVDNSISVKDDGSVEPHDTLLVPVDDWVLGFISHASNGGSTAGDQAFTHIHPDYLQELFGQRIGIEIGAKRTAPPNNAGKDTVAVLGVFTVPSLPQADAEFPQTTNHSQTVKTYPPMKPDGSHTLLIVRVQFQDEASDDDHLIRFSMGSVRLRVTTADGGFANVYPIGTVEGGYELMLSRADDFLFLQPGKAADFCFLVDNSVLPDLKVLPAKIPADADIFVEAKRYGRVSLANMDIAPLKASDTVAVLRKKYITDKIAASNPDLLKKRLVGVWTTTGPNGSPATLTYTADGHWTEEVVVNNQPMLASGTWTVVSAGADGLQITRNSGAIKLSCKIVFTDDNNATQAEGSKPPAPLTRK